ncbi:outer membrane receptor protein involved in Fe transport [Brevundimonas vesicularis]|uniref:Outer membrane receptor protein involved in Fe transport n=1 Tax=Brevundimonas vesicularis TaxID=41276 RepID=A0A7W9FR81_BREVE|nr:TonB-dependent receptor [Brevundimonas vesicularis]MBB5770073.1 outer membrane receptor protein involved in Fe transport [Brevundimonas vesicularis]
MIQDVPPPFTPTALPEIVVTAARLPPAAADAAFSVVRIDQAVLSRSSRLDEALRSVPAVSLFRRTSSAAANPTTQGISLRAIAPSGAGRTLVLLDGVPLNDPFGGWVIWSQATPESLESLDVIRGAGSGPYGAGALTGTITLRERAKGGALDVSASERGGLRAAGSASTRVGAVAVTLSGLREVSDGYVPVRGPAAGAADTPLDLDSRSAALRVDTALGQANLSVRAATWEEDRGSGLAGTRANASGHSLSATAAQAPTADGYGWRLQAWRIDSNLANSSASVSADRSTTTPANDQFKTPATGWGLNAALRRRMAEFAGGRLEWELGADARFNDGETNELFSNPTGAGFTRIRRAGGETAVAGAYVDASWSAADWLVAGGLRVDRWENTGGFRQENTLATGAVLLNESDPDRSGEVVSARLAVRRDLGGGYAARAAAYSGFRPATLNELHRPFRVGNDITEANAALTPETLKGVETGVAFDREGVRWGASVFWNQIEDAIVNVTLGSGPATFPRAGFVPAGGVLRQRQNAGIIDAWGVEVAGTLDLSSAVSLNAAASWTDAEIDGGSSAAQLTGLRPAQAPEWSATAGLDWRATDRLTLALAARYESSRFDDDLNSRVLDAAVTLDARGEWAFTPNATLWMAADNLFDEDVEVSETGTGVAGYGPPRTLSIGLRLSY